MSDKTDISPEARAQQKINDELRKKGQNVAGAQEIGELFQCEMDEILLEWRQANGMVGASMIELIPRWPDVLDYINGRPLRQKAIATFVALSKQYGIHQVVAIVDNMRIQNYTFDVIAEEPDLQINWRVIDA
jgi:hypothetical protein